MKRMILTSLLSSLCLVGYSQKLKRDEVDKYTKATIRETSFEVLAMPFMNALRFQIRKVNNHKYVVFKLSIHSVFSINEGDNIYLLLENGESITLKCFKGVVSEHLSGGGDLWYGEASYDITSEDIEKINNSSIEGARVYIRDSYIEFDRVKDKNSDKFKRALALVE